MFSDEEVEYLNIKKQTYNSCPDDSSSMSFEDSDSLLPTQLYNANNMQSEHMPWRKKCVVFSSLYALKTLVLLLIGQYIFKNYFDYELIFKSGYNNGVDMNKPLFLVLIFFISLSLSLLTLNGKIINTNDELTRLANTNYGYFYCYGVLFFTFYLASFLSNFCVAHGINFISGIIATSVIQLIYYTYSIQVKTESQNKFFTLKLPFKIISPFSIYLLTISVNKFIDSKEIIGITSFFFVVSLLILVILNLTYENDMVFSFTSMFILFSIVVSNADKDGFIFISFLLISGLTLFSMAFNILNKPRFQ